MGAAIDTTSDYLVTRTFQRELDRAFDDLMQRIIGKGNRPALIMNSETLKLPHIMWALEKIARDISTMPGDVWWAKADYYAQEAANWWQSLIFKYDADENEEVDSVRRMTLQLRR